MGVGSRCHALAALLLGKTQFPLYRRLGGPQGHLDRCEKSHHYQDLIPRLSSL